MYLDFPFQIFQTSRAIAIAFEWELDYRLIYTDGSKHPTEIDSWMGDSRGRWEGDTLVVDVSNINDKTWFDMAGDFHSNALHVVERYRMTGPYTIQYDATIEDPKVFTKPWTINVTTCSVERIGTGYSNTPVSPKWKRRTGEFSA